ncbi:MAG TPA: Rieske 2Fe-2S domain-containing protein [Kofleriaceae bacterium]|nr:Rieske 2Fe-2S domain-containing protein [Kofleriaceae bacterium]
MGSVTAQLLDELGYDPDDGLPNLGELGDFGDLRADTADGDRLAELAARAGTGPLVAGAMVAARIGARRVCLARLHSGRLIVVADECPHDGGRISDGFVDGERLVCARHGWELEARNGRCERACKLRE